jgi:hypothetical protein
VNPLTETEINNKLGRNVNMMKNCTCAARDRHLRVPSFDGVTAQIDSVKRREDRGDESSTKVLNGRSAYEDRWSHCSRPWRQELGHQI